MSNLNFAGPTPDNNVTLTQARDYVGRLALLFPNNRASILVVGPVTVAAYPIGGKTKLGDELSSEQDLLDAGVDVDMDPVEASLKFANVTNVPRFAAAFGRWLNRARPDDFDHIAMSIFGIEVNVQMARFQTQMALMANPEMAGRTLIDVMQGKPAPGPKPEPVANPSNPFGPQA